MKWILLLPNFLVSIHHAYHVTGCVQVSNTLCPPTEQYGCMCKESLCSGNQTDLFISNCKRDPSANVTSLLQAKWDMQALEMDGAKLKTIPSFICYNMTNLEYLQITNNSITSIPENCFQNLKKLRNLTLRNNKITELRFEHFTNLQDLQTLDLSNNLINSISAETWMSINNSNQITVFKLNGNKINEKTLFSVKDSVLSDQVLLHLYDNPFTCDCESSWIKDWVRRNKNRLINISNITCLNSVTGKTHVIIDIEDEEGVFVCTPVISEQQLNTVTDLAVALVMVLLGLPLILLLTCVVLYKTRHQLFLQTTWHPFDRDECEGENKDYDVYISCSTEHEEWVQQSLMPFLKSNNYKITWRREHLTSGHSIYDNIGACIENSKRTICILSKKFLDNEICMFELNYSLNMDTKYKRRRTVIVAAADYDMVQVDKNVQTNMKKYTLIEKDSGKFSQILPYYLPISSKLGETKQNDFTKTVDECFAVDVPQEVPMYDYF